jgi:S-phase kinase-associated protein 1
MDRLNPQVILLASDWNQGTPSLPNGKIQVSRKAIEQSKLIQSMLVDDDDDDDAPEIPLFEVSWATLRKVVDFLEHHEHDPMQEIAKPIQTTDIVKLVGEWDANYIACAYESGVHGYDPTDPNKVNQEKLIHIILAANYMDIPPLLELGLCKLATMVKGKEPDEVKKLFNIAMDITPEEEKSVRDANPWIFEDGLEAAPAAQ